MKTTESSLNRRYRQGAVLAIALSGLIPAGGGAATYAQDVPGLDGVSIAPVPPSPTPTPAPTPTRQARRPLPPPDVVPEPELGPIGLGLPVSSTPRSPRTAAPTPRATPSPVPDPEEQRAAPVEQAAPVQDLAPPLPASTPTPTPTPAPRDRRAPDFAIGDPLPFAGAAALAALLVIGGLIWFGRRRRDRAAIVRSDEPIAASPTMQQPSAPAPEPAPPPAEPAPAPMPDQRKPSMLRPTPPPPPQPPAPAEPALRPWLEIDFVPRRAGTNLTSATVDFELAIRNIGSVAANDVRVLVQLLTANPHQNAQLQTVFDRPTDQPIIAPFALEPHDTARINAVGTLAVDKINRLELEGRPMFVPIMAVRAVYNWAGNRGDRGSTANAYILGVGREGQGKMQPLWLDAGPRMADRITHRLHEIGVRR